MRGPQKLFSETHNSKAKTLMQVKLVVSIVKEGWDSVVFKVLHAVCPPPQVSRESLLEVLDSLTVNCKGS